MNDTDFHTDRAFIELDLKALRHNAEILQNAMPQNCRLMAVVKCNAYGHGSILIAKELQKIGVQSFAVATADEGIDLRRHGIRGEILVLGYTAVHRAEELQKYNLMQTVIDFAYAEALQKTGVSLNVHIKLDTGMHRLGIPFDAMEAVKAVFSMPNLQVCGMYTHLCCADSLAPDDTTFTEAQIERFYQSVSALKADGIPIPKLHIQSSYGLLNYPHLQCDYVRAGIALYGVLSSPNDKTRLQLQLQPVLSLKSRVALIRTVPANTFVGYGRAFYAARESRLAVLPIGYGDGLPRNLSNGKGSVEIHGYRVPIVGRICMDQLTVDITDTKGIAVGDTATLIGANTENTPSAPETATRADSITNELLCRMGARLACVLKN